MEEEDWVSVRAHQYANEPGAHDVEDSHPRASVYWTARARRCCIQSVLKPKKRIRDQGPLHAAYLSHGVEAFKQICAVNQKQQAESTPSSKPRYLDSRSANKIIMQDHFAPIYCSVWDEKS